MKNLIIAFLMFFTVTWYNQRGEVGFMGGGEGEGGGEGGSGDGGSGGSGGEGAGGSGEGGDGAGGSGAGGQEPTVNYPEGLEEELHGNKTLLKFYDPEKKEFNNNQIMKALAHSVQNIGKDKITIPDQDTTPEQLTEFYQKIGVPSDLAKYEVNNSVPEGMQANDDMFGKFKSTAHELGVHPKQAQGIIDFFNTYVNESAVAGNEEAKTAFNNEKSLLQTKWGTAYEKKIGNAKTALENFASQEQMEALQKAGIMDNLAITEIFSGIFDGLMTEDTFSRKGKDAFGMTVEDAQAKIEEFWTKGHPYQNSQHPNWANLNKQYMKYVAIAKGRNPAS